MNKLEKETSPYLLQHADNPVHWFPWGDEALAEAARTDKPILLSIGYSACHWCHVMAHESFEDPATAAIMNRLFVNIKVDREERPDLDRIYQSAHSMLNRKSGGWPLTMFLTPDDQVPFFGGTYFPPSSRHGLPAFTDLLERVAAFYRDHKQEILEQNDALMTAFRSVNRTAAHCDPEAVVLDMAVQQLARDFDDTYGGFGSAPKFPHPDALRFLLYTGNLSPQTPATDDVASNMFNYSAENMANGGVFDQLGGGFYRYSVDERWEIPHFEKMLYDNAQLLRLYSEGYAVTGNPLYQSMAEQTAGWVIRDMQSARGGYFSSLDADSEGEEGRFYVWSRNEILDSLDQPDYRLAEGVYGLNQKPNFEGKWHLNIAASPEQIAEQTGKDPEQTRLQLNAIRERLLQKRNRRTPPPRDDKILTAWNGLMISGMASAARVFDKPQWTESAERCLDAVRTRLWKNGRLLATEKDGDARLPAYLDDYVFLIDGILALLQTRWRTADLDFAIELTEVVLRHFQDPQGGFFFTANDHEQLIQRPKPLSDDATPSGNGIAAQILIRLGHLLGESRYLSAAENTLRAAWHSVSQAPYLHCSLLMATRSFLFPDPMIVIRADHETGRKWRNRIGTNRSINASVFIIPGNASGLPPSLQEKPARTDGPVAYICRGEQCLPPATTIQALNDAFVSGQDNTGV